MKSGIRMRDRVTHTAIAICLVAFASSPVSAESNSRRGLDLVFMVDADKFAAGDLTRFRKSLLDQAAMSGATEPVTLKPGETLNQMVARVYGYGDNNGWSPFRQIQADLVNSIIDVNKVEPTKVRPGQTLQVPQFIRRPLTKGSSLNKAQVLNASTSSLDNVARDTFTRRTWSYTIEAASSAVETSIWTRKTATADEAVVSSSTQREAGTTVIVVDADNLSQLGGLSGLQAKVRDGTFSLLPNTAEYVVNFGQTSLETITQKITEESKEQPPDLFPLTPDQINKVKQAGLGKLYLLDVFSAEGGCKHGDLVYDKSVQTLNSLGLSSEKNRIVKQSIDFYADKPKNIQFIKNWIQRSFQGQALQNYNLALAALMQTAPPIGLASDAIAIPGLFLQALYGTLAEDPSALVVSGSFYTSAEGSVFPKDIILNVRANLVNAVLNDDSAIEAPTQYFQEPLSTFNLYRELLGTVLVGYFDEAGVPRGMYSQTGLGVTTIDDGVVVGAQGGCKGMKGTGASFAAPVVATKLLVGRMLWAKKPNIPDPIAARNRLLASSFVQKAYLGKYRSGGAASAAKLYAPEGRYAVAPNGVSTDASRMGGQLTVTVEIPLALGVKFVDYVFDTEPGDISPGFISLLLNDDSAFMLEKQMMQPPVWTERKVKSICICGDDKKALSLSEAIKLFREVRRND